MVVRPGVAVQFVEVEVGIQILVSNVLVGNKMIVVGACFGGEGDRVAGAESVCSRKRIANNLDLVRVLRGRHIQDSSPSLGDIVAAFQKEQVGSEVAAAKVQKGVILVGRVFASAACQQLPVALHVNGGIQCRKGKHISEIEGKFFNLL